LYEKILNKIITPTFNALKSEGIDYKGVLYRGIIIKDSEPYLLEYNCRFGDPETQAILPRLKDDIVPLLVNCTRGTLDDIELSWEDKKTVCTVLASKSYPESSSKGDVITGLEDLKQEKDLLIFHAGTKNNDGSIVTDGGRVLNIVSMASSFRQARRLNYESIKKIKFEGMQFRKDIALKVEET